MTTATHWNVYVKPEGRLGIGSIGQVVGENKTLALGTARLTYAATGDRPSGDKSPVIFDNDGVEVDKA